MSLFENIKLTNNGLNLQSKAQVGKMLKFTNIKIGDGKIGSTPVSTITDLKNFKLTIELNKFKVLTDGQAVIGGILSNTSVTEGFYWREIGLYAEDPDTGLEILYAYGNCGDLAEFIPAVDSNTIIEKVVNIIILTSNIENVTASINNSLVYLSLDGDASNTSVTFTESKEKTDIESGDTLSGLFGKIKKWFSSFAKVAFSGSYNDLKDVVEEVFIATYNVTTYAEIQNAVNTGKVILLDYGGTHRLQLTFISAEQFNFAGYVDAGTILYNAICKSTNEWTLEAKDNTIPKISYSTEELEPGVSPLATGQIHLTYE